MAHREETRAEHRRRCLGGAGSLRREGESWLERGVAGGLRSSEIPPFCRPRPRSEGGARTPAKGRRGGAPGARRGGSPVRRGRPPHEQQRSEEHTSELQSPCNLVCRLLLEKK